MMIQKHILSFVSAIAAAIILSSTHSFGDTDGMVRDYVDRAKLTEDEEKKVIELAEKRGIKTVAAIKTYYLRPSSARGISVMGTERIKGREVSYKMLKVNRKGWTHRSNAPKEGDLQVGDFWAGKAWDQKLTILRVGEKEYRIGAPHGLTIDQCESMLKQLQGRDYTLEPKAQKTRLRGIDWNKPKSFSKFGEHINASFREIDDGDGHYSLRLSLIDGKIVIHEIMLAMP